MREEDKQQLIKLLKQAISENNYLENGPWELVQQLTSWSAIELVIMHPDREGVFLAHRNDIVRGWAKLGRFTRPAYEGWEGFTGWHFVGGYVRPKENTQQAVDRMANEIDGRPELKIMGIDFVHKWLDHPYAFPYSVGLRCKILGRKIPPEYTGQRFFRNISEVPFFIHPMHKIFLREVLHRIKKVPDKYLAKVL